MSSNPNKITRIPKPVQPVLSSSSKPKASCLNPLAKAMEKKTTNKTQQPESWYDEEIESVSQKHQHLTKTEHEKRKEELFAQLKKTESELVVMQDLLHEREKMMKEAQEAQEEEDYSKHKESEDVLVEGKTEDGSGEQNSGKITKKTMKEMRDKMQGMREKLHKMNKDTDIYLADIENTMQYLESLEVASLRLGPLSDETRQLFGDVDDETLIAQISMENKQTQQQDELEKSNEDGESPKEVVTNDSNQHKFFVTEKTAVSNCLEECVEDKHDTGNE